MQTTPNRSVIDVLTTEINRLEGLTTKLKDTRLALQMGRSEEPFDLKPVSVPTRALKLAPKAKGKPKRVAYGKFQETLLSCFTGDEPLSNADVRAKLESLNWPTTSNRNFSMQVRKKLLALAKAGKLRAIKDQETENVRYMVAV